MDSILRLLILTLFVTVTFSLGIQPEIPLVTTNGTITIGGFPNATQINAEPLYFTGYPGLAHINITAVSSVSVCISPYVAVTSNLQTQCPPQNLKNFYYTALSPESEFLLFLDDFSMNFMGQDGNSGKRTEASIPPYEPQYGSLTLLQQIPYYITIGLFDNYPANSTEREVLEFTLYANYPNCGNNSVASSDVEKRGSLNGCTPLNSQLTPTESSSAPLTVNSTTPLVFSFEITSLSLTAQLDFHIHSLDFNLTIFIGFGYVPNAFTYDYKISNSSLSLNDTDMTAEFLGDIIQSFSVVIPQPKVGTYYAVVNSALPSQTNFDIEFNTTSCDISNNQCGSVTFQSFDSSDVQVQTITLTNEPQYIVVTGTFVNFGIATGDAAVTTFYQVDVNAIPSMVLNQKPPAFKQNVSSVVGISLQGPNALTYVFGFENGAVLNNSLDAPQALLWTGSVCPGNCNNAGTCDFNTFECTCGDGYSGSYCQTGPPPPNQPNNPPGSPPSNPKKKFPTLYIILIIIGGAILLAILIGVPVALFLNNRKKARYERV
jgi:hypothetical protein